MSIGIKRSRKNTKISLEEVREELDLPDYKYRCFHNRMPRYCTLDICCLKCDYPCDNYLNFYFVMDDCRNEDCSREFPCSDCLETIEDIKLYKKIVSSLEDDWKKVYKRFNNYTKKRNKKKG